MAKPTKQAIVLSPSAITRNLQPGMSGDDVRKLQAALIKAGYPIPDGPTGYYGSQTKAAVADWQKSEGIKTDGNPGFFGPRSVAALGGAPVAPAKVAPGVAPIAPVAGAPVKVDPAAPVASITPAATPDLDSALRKFGLSSGTISALSPAQKETLASMGSAIQLQYDNGKEVPTVLTQPDLDRIFQEAQDSPDIDEFYKNNLRLGGEELKRTVNFLTGEWNQFSKENATNYELDKKRLSEEAAAAGRAFSGFRGQAKEQLDNENAGVIESTRRSLARNLDTLGTSFEQKYGTGSLPTGLLELGGEKYTPYGDVPGTEAANRLGDVRDRNSELIQEEFTRRGTSSPA